VNPIIGRARAPSNIALIKYMGKKEGSANLPENSSISLTLNSLCTLAEVSRELDGPVEFQWTGEAPEFVTGDGPVLVPQLQDEAISKIQSHVRRTDREVPAILKHFGLESFPPGGRFILKSANTFPAASGIASSASAFAAITLATTLTIACDKELFSRAFKSEPKLRSLLAAISRQGSGSSCRSFDGPWVFWENEQAEKLESRLPELAHFVLLVSASEKSVSSSTAHHRVKSSPLWSGRVDRANARAQQLKTALASGDLNQVARLSWSECWEMHSLFHTAEPPFTYWQPQTIGALNWFSAFLNSPASAANPFPIVTLDAGPNLHCLVPLEAAADWEQRIRTAFPDTVLLCDRQGKGAEVIS